MLDIETADYTIQHGRHFKRRVTLAIIVWAVWLNPAIIKQTCIIVSEMTI